MLTRLPVAMSEGEIGCYKDRLSRAVSVIEYGCGGSTVLALKSGIERLVSVETDPEWITKLRGFGLIRRAESRGRLTLLHADIGPVRAWGMPTDRSGAARYADYSQLPWQHCSADLALIDGRFRVASAMESLLRGATIVFHDFWDRAFYHAILPLADCLERVDTMGVFKLQAGADLDAARDVLERYRSVPE